MASTIKNIKQLNPNMATGVLRKINQSWIKGEGKISSK
jgi:hypothetical protein